MELIRSRNGHLRGVGTGSVLVREGLGRNSSRASCESKGDDGWFLKVNGSVKLGQHEGLLSYGPAFRPTAVGQPLKGSRIKRGLTSQPT